MRTNDDLIDDVETRAPSYLGGTAREGEVIAAMRRVDRGLFLPSSPPAEAYEDRAVPIGSGQTCSEPSMVAFMLELLELRAGHRVLEVGAGSGYAAAAAALLCPGGAVYACETSESLAAAMPGRLAAWRERLRDRGETRSIAAIEVIGADGSAGFPELAPFDRILVSAGVLARRGGSGFSEVPLLAQLADGGILLYPEAYGDLHRTRKSGKAYARESWPGVAFVPLRGRNA